MPSNPNEFSSQTSKVQNDMSDHRRAKSLLQAIYLAFIFCVIATISAKPAYAASQGHVTKRISGCDYFIVDANQGYAILEWYGGHDPDSGDLLIGAFETYGMHDIIDDTADENLTVWTEDYGLSRARALEVLIDKCGD